ncbi:transferrin [Belonocnema kinseyi]|uniref:transferrin n=1 Tax=Belonocnema kinseyi TaxID=2817044 RepID=UPI00143D0B12|nr:transferrin [Belonocnema kinseyi]
MSFKVSTFIGFILILHLQFPVFTQNNKLKFCVVESKHTENNIKICPNLIKSESEVECVLTTDRISCLRLLINDEVDFTTVEPEDLMVLGMTEKYNQKVLVTHELRIWEKKRARFQLVTIVRKSIENAWQTPKKRFCSPGLEPGLFALDYVKYFENQLINTECDQKKTFLANRMSSLSSYFESACISGPWTSDKNFDLKLKEKYRNLCSQCGSPKCSKGDKYYGREGVLLCLTDGGGDIAWSRLDYVQEHFKALNDDENEYYFLCPDGTTRNLTSPDPCVWFEEPWKTTVARKEVSEVVTKLLNSEANTVSDFLSLLELDVHRELIRIETFRTPSDYLKISFPEFYSFKKHVKCSPERVIKWCVVRNLEAEKCDWISKAAGSYGVEPLIECIQESSREKCIKSVINRKSDIFAVSQYDYFETRTKGLKPIVHMVSNKATHEHEIVAIVRNSSNLNSFEDLKNHKACFSSYRDAGWNSFIYTMKNLTGNNNWYTRDMEMVSQFFSESCVFDQKNATLPQNLYSFCSQIKNIAKYKKPDEAALHCLENGGADVAFVNLSSVMHYQQASLLKYYKALCANGFMYDSGKKEKCYLTWTTPGSIMVHNNISRVKEDDIYLMLMDLNELFGIQYQGWTPLISMYSSFGGESNVIFSQKTQYLLREVRGLRSKVSYPEILEELMALRKLSSEANSPNLNIEFIFLVPLIYSISI